MSDLDAIRERVLAVRERLSEIRPDYRVRLMAVTKFRSREEALAAVLAGADVIGENRVQEARQKWESEKPPCPLHLIGQLQTNKVKYGIQLFDVIESLDRPRLAEALTRGLNEPFPVMVEVNIGREATKAGVLPEAVGAWLRQPDRWTRLKIIGFMTVLPAKRDKSLAEERRIRHYIREMVDLWQAMRREQWPWAPLDHLSMGMSEDWEWAVEAGSTQIRLGTTLFGPRPGDGQGP